MVAGVQRVDIGCRPRLNGYRVRRGRWAGDVGAQLDGAAWVAVGAKPVAVEIQVEACGGTEFGQHKWQAVAL